MRRFGTHFFRNRNGLPPGTLIDAPDLEDGSIRLVRYGHDGIVEDRFLDPGELPLNTPDGLVDWVQVKGVHDADLMHQVGKAYKIHEVTMEDLQNTDRRPSFEKTGDAFYLTIKRLKTAGTFLEIDSETIGVILTGRTAVTFLENTSEGHPTLETRLTMQSRLREFGADYLVYRIWDQSVDTWLLATDLVENHIMETEENVLFNNDNALLEVLHVARKRIGWMRWVFGPYREIRSWISGSAPKWFSVESQQYLNDLADHTNRVMDLLDVYRNLIVDLFSVHMSILNIRMNSVMKVLTVIATIFIPLTFIAGIYGMNFKHMPELSWKWAYPAVLGFMLVVATGMIVFIRRKKWY